MKKTSKHVKFLVKLQTAAFGGGGEEPDLVKSSGETEDDGEYKVLDEDGLNELMQVFAGA